MNERKCFSMLSLVLGTGTVLSKCFLSLEKSPWFFIAPGHLPPPTCFLCPGDTLHMKKQTNKQTNKTGSTGQPSSGGLWPQEGGGKKWCPVQCENRSDSLPSQGASFAWSVSLTLHPGNPHLSFMSQLKSLFLRGFLWPL